MDLGAFANEPKSTSSLKIGAIFIEKIRIFVVVIICNIHNQLILILI